MITRGNAFLSLNLESVEFLNRNDAKANVLKKKKIKYVIYSFTTMLLSGKIWHSEIFPN